MEFVRGLDPFYAVASRNLIRLPRSRWLLQFFLVDHIDRTLEAIGRRYAARAALGIADVSDESDKRITEYFRQSLPPAKRRTYATLLLLASVLLAYIALPSLASTFAVDVPRGQIREFVASVESSWENPASLRGFLDELSTANLDTLRYVGSGFLVILYLILRPAAGTFRVKRMLFDLYPATDGLACVPLSLSIPRSTGLYELENSVFRSIGLKGQRELPFDLLVAPLPILLLVILSPSILEPIWFGSIIFAVLGCIFIVIRLRWLMCVWRSRRSVQAGSIASLSVTSGSRQTQARWSLVMGIISIPLGLVGVGLVIAIVGLVLARMSDAASTYSAGCYSNRRVTIAAKALCWTGIVVTLALLV